MDNRKRVASSEMSDTNNVDDTMKKRRFDDEEATEDHSSSDHANGNSLEPTAEFASITPTVFVKRGSDRFTPMISLDDLPTGTNIVGLKNYYSMDEVEQVNGQIVFAPKAPGQLEFGDGTKVVAGSADANGQQVPSSRSINERLTAALNDPHTPVPASGPYGHVYTAPRRGIPTAAATTTQRYNPTTPGVLGQKVYCTHWMRTGECDFTQQGCMFLHCMPDLDTLEKLGFRAYPRWFREMPRQFQELNSKEFSTDGLNPQRVQMREMHNMQAQQSHHGHHGLGVPQSYLTHHQAHGMAPPPPPPPPAESPNNGSLFGTGRRGSAAWRSSSGSSTSFPQFAAKEPASLYNGQVSNTSAGRRGRHSAPDSRSVLSRDGSRESANEKLRAHSAVTPSLTGSDGSSRGLPKKPTTSYKAPTRAAMEAKARSEKEKEKERSRIAQEAERAKETPVKQEDTYMASDPEHHDGADAV